MEEDEALGVVVHLHRRRQRKRLEALAAAVGVSMRRMSHLEGGRARWQPEEIRRTASFLGLATDVLLSQAEALRYVFVQPRELRPSAHPGLVETVRQLARTTR